ncbi:hypothetical protein JCM3766R1_006825 [Sporobolomyces carnicolor]
MMTMNLGLETTAVRQGDDRSNCNKTTLEPWDNVARDLEELAILSTTTPSPPPPFSQGLEAEEEEQDDDDVDASTTWNPEVFTANLIARGAGGGGREGRRLPNRRVSYQVPDERDESTFVVRSHVVPLVVETSLASSTTANANTSSDHKGKKKKQQNTDIVD